MRIRLLNLVAAVAFALPAHADGIRVLNDDAHFPEGPIWHQGKLYYVEYDRNSVTTWDGHKNLIFWSEKGCGPSAVIATKTGELLTTCYDNGSIGRMTNDGKTLPPYTQDKDGNRFVGPNDFAPDAHGGMYFTTSGDPYPAINGRVFYLAADGTIAQAARDVHSANGLVVSGDGKLLYVVETEAHRLIQFKIGSDATLSDRRVFWPM